MGAPSRWRWCCCCCCCCCHRGAASSSWEYGPLISREGVVGNTTNQGQEHSYHLSQAAYLRAGGGETPMPCCWDERQHVLNAAERSNFFSQHPSMWRYKCRARHAGISVCIVVIMAMLVFGSTVLGLLSSALGGTPRHGRSFVEQWLPAECRARTIYTEQTEQCCSGHSNSHSQRYTDDDGAQPQPRGSLDHGAAAEFEDFSSTETSSSQQTGAAGARNLAACNTNCESIHK